MSAPSTRASADATDAAPDDREIILNLWYVYDDLGMIYSLRGRCYVGSGSDEQKSSFLLRSAATDYLIAQPFPVPERLHTTFPSGDGTQKLPVGDLEAIELIGGPGALFEEVFVELAAPLAQRSPARLRRRFQLRVFFLAHFETDRFRAQWRLHHLRLAPGRISAETSSICLESTSSPALTCACRTATRWREFFFSCSRFNKFARANPPLARSTRSGVTCRSVNPSVGFELPRIPHNSNPVPTGFPSASYFETALGLTTTSSSSTSG
jgi:hypothetical protein